MVAPQHGENTVRRGFRLRGAENRNRKRLDVSGRRDNTKSGRQRRIVLRREEGRNQDEIGDALSDRADRALGRIGEDQLRPRVAAYEAVEQRRLTPIGFDRENQRHS